MLLERQLRPEALELRRRDYIDCRRTRRSKREGRRRRSMTFGTTIRIARMHHPYCLTWRGDDLRFV
jgi:hypothetical protein